MGIAASALKGRVTGIGGGTYRDVPPGVTPVIWSQGPACISLCRQNAIAMQVSVLVQGHKSSLNVMASAFQMGLFTRRRRRNPISWRVRSNSWLEDVIRFDHDGSTFAVYRSPDGALYATGGQCTHEQVHLADGLVMDNISECPKHNGRFDYRTGEAGKVMIQIGRPAA